MDVFRAGRAYLLSGGQVGATHLWCVLTDPDPKTRHVITVMVVSAKPYTDKTVTLAAGEHPFIRHESNVDYGTARSMPVSRLTSANEQGRLHLMADLSPALLARIRAGLLASSRTIHAVKDQLR